MNSWWAHIHWICALVASQLNAIEVIINVERWHSKIQCGLNGTCSTLEHRILFGWVRFTGSRWALINWISIWQIIFLKRLLLVCNKIWYNITPTLLNWNFWKTLRIVKAIPSSYTRLGSTRPNACVGLYQVVQFWLPACMLCTHARVSHTACDCN